MLNGEADEKRMADSREPGEETEVLAKILDAAMTGDGARLRELLGQHPHFREEFEGLDEDYAEFQTAMQSDPSWLEGECAGAPHDIEELVAEAEKRRIGSLTHATRTWSRPEVVRLYQSIAEYIVRFMAREVGHEIRSDEIEADGEYLCSPEVIKELQEAVRTGRHARDMAIEVLAKRWGDRAFADRITREKLGAQLMKNPRFRQQFAAWEDRMLQPVGGHGDQ